MSLSTVKKGSTLRIVKDGNVLDKVIIRLTWESTKNMDFDLSTVALKHTDGFPFGKGVSESHVCYFDAPNTPAMKSSGDDLGKDEDEASEEIEIEFSRLPKETTHVHAIVTLYDAARRRHSFGDVKSMKLELVDPKDNMVLMETVADDLKSTDTSLLFVSFNREDDGFSFTAVNQGYKKEIGDFFVAYGFDVE